MKESFCTPHLLSLKSDCDEGSKIFSTLGLVSYKLVSYKKKSLGTKEWVDVNDLTYY